MNWSDKGRSGSFRNTLNYILHDKDASTTDRVGNIECLNLGSDPYEAWLEMKATADAAPDLKSRADVANPQARCSRPVFHYTLSWHPDDSPDREHMMEQARITLGILGLQDHQAVISQHTDRPHPHLHVVVNLIHPDTGRTANLSHHKLKLDTWAHQYETARTIRSPKRADRHERAMKPREKAQKIGEKYRDKKAAMGKRHQEARQNRFDEKSRLSDDYWTDRQDIYDKADAELKALWSNRPASPSLDLKSKSVPKRAEWKDLAKALKPYLGEAHFPLRKEYRQALERISPAPPKTLETRFKEARNLARPRTKVEEGRDVMLPIRNTPESRRFARQARKQQSQEIRQAREQALAARKANYDMDCLKLKEKHEEQIKTERVERATMRTEVAHEWETFAEENSLKPQQKPEWMARLAEEDAALLQEAQQDPAQHPTPEPVKPTEAPSPTQSWRDAAEGPDWSGPTDQAPTPNRGPDISR